ncbi:hypothetical protein CEQ90_19220 [Lewinellaceae bacterium SD302]|nr:hypothetical protein CEQ90_19220 [Lewinellaceae bacterium SD302]
MITQEKAISILDDYLHHMYNVDPLQKLNVKAHRLYVSEFNGYWQLQMSSIQNYDKIVEGPSEWVGGGTYFLDKNSGEIYEIGSSPFYNWHQEFENFKKGVKSQINWEPKVNNYINCRVEDRLRLYRKMESLQCKYDNRDSQLEKYFRRSQDKIDIGDRYFTFRRIAFESNAGEIPVSFNAELTDKTKRVVIQNFDGGLDGFSVALNEAKKFCRVNGLQLTDNYYAIIIDSNLSKPINDWECQLEMTL